MKKNFAYLFSFCILDLPEVSTDEPSSIEHSEPATLSSRSYPPRFCLHLFYPCWLRNHPLHPHRPLLRHHLRLHRPHHRLRHRLPSCRQATSHPTTLPRAPTPHPHRHRAHVSSPEPAAADTHHTRREPHLHIRLRTPAAHSLRTAGRRSPAADHSPAAHTPVAVAADHHSHNPPAAAHTATAEADYVARHQASTRIRQSHPF